MSVFDQQRLPTLAYHRVESGVDTETSCDDGLMGDGRTLLPSKVAALHSSSSMLMPLAGYTPVAQTYNAGMHTMLSLRMATTRTAHQSWQLSARSC